MNLNKKIITELIKEVIEENTKTTYSYASTQVQIDEDTANEIIEFGLTIPDEYIYTDDEDKSFGREDDIHCTVLYGLTSNDVTPVADILSQFDPFTITLGDISYFESELYDVMKIEVISEYLNDIHYTLRDNLENENKFPEYNPHVTIAYVTKDFDRNSIDNSTFSGIEVDIDSVIFSQTDNNRVEIKL